MLGLPAEAYPRRMTQPVDGGNWARPRPCLNAHAAFLEGPWLWLGLRTATLEYARACLGQCAAAAAATRSCRAARLRDAATDLKGAAMPIDLEGTRATLTAPDGITGVKGSGHDQSSLISRVMGKGATDRWNCNAWGLGGEIKLAPRPVTPAACTNELHLRSTVCICAPSNLKMLGQEKHGVGDREDRGSRILGFGTELAEGDGDDDGVPVLGGWVLCTVEICMGAHVCVCGCVRACVYAYIQTFIQVIPPFSSYLCRIWATAAKVALGSC